MSINMGPGFGDGAASGSQPGAGKDNGSNNEPVHVDPWDPNLKVKLKKTDDNQQQQQQTQQSTNNQQPQQDVGKMFADHVASLDFGFKVTPEMHEKIAAGDYTDFAAAQQNAMREVYKRVIFDTQKMLETVKTQAIEAAKQNTNSTLTTDKHKQQIGQDIPLYKSNPALAPVIEGSVAKYLGAGVDITSAIEMTKTYLKKIGVSLAEEGFGGNDNGYGQQTQRRGGDMDWDAFAKQ